MNLKPASAIRFSTGDRHFFRTGLGDLACQQPYDFLPKMN